MVRSQVAASRVLPAALVERGVTTFAVNTGIWLMAAPEFDKGTLARTLIGPCGQVTGLPDRRQAYGPSPLVKFLHSQRYHATTIAEPLAVTARCRQAGVAGVHNYAHHGMLTQLVGAAMWLQRVESGSRGLCDAMLRRTCRLARGLDCLNDPMVDGSSSWYAGVGELLALWELRQFDRV
jgi:hypothetical protein